MATIDQIKEKYLGDDAFSKGVNAVGHEISQYKGKMKPSQLNYHKGIAIAREYAKANEFKRASIFYNPNKGWEVSGRVSGRIDPTEAQAYAQDLLKAVAAIKKAPTIKK